MSPTEVVRLLLTKLEDARAEYLLVGAFAVQAWAWPRATHDADFVVTMESAELEEFLGELPLGMSLDPQSRMELFTGTTRWILHVADIAFKVEIFLRGSDPHHVEMFLRKRRELLATIGREAWIPAPEDMIIQKLRWARLTDLDDARNILSMQGEIIDHGYLESWCAKHGTLNRLAELRSEMPPGI